MNTVKKRKSLKYWLSQALQMVLMVTVISVAMDWYRTKDIPKEQAPPLSVVMADGEYMDVIAKSMKSPLWSTFGQLGVRHVSLLAQA